MTTFQPGILAPPPPHARYLSFRTQVEVDIGPSLAALASHCDGEEIVVGLGEPVTSALDRTISGLRSFAPLTGPQVSVPATQIALWCWLRGTDRGTLLHRARKLESLLAETFVLEETIEAFVHRDSRDLTGYEDGTENPEGDKALETAFVAGAGPGLDGSSFVAVQRWIHDFGSFDSMTQTERDNTIGRRIEDNEEIEDAPASAHVKRTAQEDFDPEAFVLRRSMPWSDRTAAGLMFVAFGKSLDAFEAQMRRMVGLDDGIVDGLFRFTRPVTGSALWCPPVADGKLDLRALGR